MANGVEAWALERQLTRPGPVTNCAWSPDGTRLATVGGGRVGVWDVFTGASPPPLRASPSSAPSSSPSASLTTPPKPPLQHPTPPLAASLTTRLRDIGTARARISARAGECFVPAGVHDTRVTAAPRLSAALSLSSPLRYAFGFAP